MGVQVLCRRFSGLKLVLSSYADDDTSCVEQLPPCAVHASGVTGNKPIHWLRHLPPAATVGFEFVWLFDSDLDVGSFDLGRAVAIMRWSSALVGQPCISAPPGNRSTYYAFLRCSLSTSQAVSCLAQHVRLVEQMSPIFSTAAWARVHSKLLSVLPESYLAKADYGLDLTWCRMLELSDAVDSRTPCVLLVNVSISHFSTRSKGLLHQAPEQTLLFRELRQRFPAFTSNYSGAHEKKGCARKG